METFCLSNTEAVQVMGEFQVSATVYAHRIWTGKLLFSYVRNIFLRVFEQAKFTRANIMLNY